MRESSNLKLSLLGTKIWASQNIVPVVLEENNYTSRYLKAWRAYFIYCFDGAENSVIIM
jgi:hypothetical protein